MDASLMCAICNKKFDDPCILNCGHSFCNKCIKIKDYRTTCITCGSVSLLPANGQWIRNISICNIINGSDNIETLKRPRSVDLDDMKITKIPKRKCIVNNIIFYGNTTVKLLDSKIEFNGSATMFIDNETFYVFVAAEAATKTTLPRVFKNMSQHRNFNARNEFYFPQDIKFTVKKIMCNDSVILEVEKIKLLDYKRMNIIGIDNSSIRFTEKLEMFSSLFVTAKGNCIINGCRTPVSCGTYVAYNNGSITQFDCIMRAVFKGHDRGYIQAKVHPNTSVNINTEPTAQIKLLKKEGNKLNLPKK